MNEVDVISRSEMDNFRHKLQEDKDMFSTHLGLLKKVCTNFLCHDL